ncbi:MAG TPA: hypothetical protein VHA75_03100 [Rugosimonospora sp.]|nr:hypothetical protein [Rugosimonospora sp.]
MTWAKDINGNYVNLEQVIGMYANQNGSDWTIQVYTVAGGTVDLAGVLGSEAAVQAVMARLVNAVDPETYS